MNLHKLSKRHSIHTMQPQPAPGRSAATDESASFGTGAKQRKKGKFRLKERSSSSVRERFVNDPAYTEDVRHLALPMRRNSGPENVEPSSRSSKFYTIPKKKSNSVGKDYLRASGETPAGTGAQGFDSREFYSVDASEMARQMKTGGGGGGPAAASDQSFMQVKVRRKKYNYHNSSEMLQFNDESSSSENMRQSKSSGTLNRRGRSLDRRAGAGTTAELPWWEQNKEQKEFVDAKQSTDGRSDGASEQSEGRNRNLIRRQNAAEYSGRGEGGDVGVADAGDASGTMISQEEAIYRRTENTGGRHCWEEGGDDLKESKSKFQIGKRFLKGEIGIKSFNYYLLKEGLKSSKKNLLKQRSAPVEVGGIEADVDLSKSEENIYEEIYFEDKLDDPSNEKIQFVDCELCVQQCSNSSCDVCNGHISTHKLQQHHHHHRQKELDQQNVYEKLKKIPQQQLPAGSQYKTARSLDIDSANANGTGAGNVLQYQSYNPNNPNIFKLETTPVAFSCDYNPIKKIHYNPQQDAAGGSHRQRSLYQQAPSSVSPGSDYYKEINRKKSSSSSDSIQARMQRELYQQANLYYYHRKIATGETQNQEPNQASNIHKTSSNASILSEASARSENSLKQPRTGNMSDSSLGDSLFSYSANRRYFGSSESCRFASECRRCSLDVDKCSFSDTCRYDCQNCDCSSSYFSSDFDDTGHGTGRKNSSRTSASNVQVDLDAGSAGYSVPAYAEDFMKHVSNVKRNQLGHQLRQQKHTPSGKIYEMPTTYVGNPKKAPVHYEHTYEKLKSNPYGSSGYQRQAMYKCDEYVTKQSISQSQETLLSPSRNRLPMEARNSSGLTGHYRAHTSNTLPASISCRTKSNEFDNLSSSSRSIAGTLPKSFTGPTTKAILSNLNHDYAEIIQLPSTENKEKAAGGKETETNQPTTRRQAPPIPPNPPLPEPNEEIDPRSITSGGGLGNTVSQNAQTPAMTSSAPSHYSPSRRNEFQPRKDRAEFEKSKRGAAAAVASTIQVVVPPSSINQSVASRKKDQTSCQKEKASKMKQQQQVVAPVPAGDEGNFTDDEDDEVFLSDKVYERPNYRTRKPNPPPNAPITAANKTPRAVASAKTGTRYTAQPPSSTLSSIPSSQATATASVMTAAASTVTSTTTTTSALLPASKASAPPKSPKQRTKQPEPSTTAKASSALPATSPNGRRLDGSNESESLRKLHQAAAPGVPLASESVSDLVRKSDEPVAPAEHVEIRGYGPTTTTTTTMMMTMATATTTTRIKTKSSAQELSTDLAVSGETAQQPASGRRLAATVSVYSNRSPEENSSSVNASPSRSAGHHKLQNTPTSEESASIKQSESSQEVSQPDPTNSFNSVPHPPAAGKDDATDNTNEIKLIGNDECDIIDFPLPEIPVRQDPTSSDTSFLTATDGTDTAGSYVKSPTLTRKDKTNDCESKDNQDNQVAQTKAMHYRNSNDKPTYLFGENLKKNEIFLNKSGWVQVSQPPPHPFDRSARAKSYQSDLVGQNVSRKYIEYDESRHGKGNKLEDLINRNEARKHQVQKIQRQDNVTILKIDPEQSSSGRPVCLPIKRNLADNSPPPVTPILSPPPAFQDSKYKNRLREIKPGTHIFLSVADNENRNPKGMVFSRSFEYDNRRYTTSSVIAAQQQKQKQSYVDTFSKSFDFESTLAAPMPKTTDQPFIRRNRSPTFSTLTGNSPNYLTKKEKSGNLVGILKDNSPIFPKTIPGSGITSSGHELLKRFSDKNKSLDSQFMSSSTTAAGGLNRSRRSQFSTKANSTHGLSSYGFRSDSVGNTRLNSCDSGARSDYSNDGVEDDEEDASEDQSSSLALSYKSSTSYINQMKSRSLHGSFGSGNTLTAHSALKPQRSLTPERLYDNEDYGSIRNLKKQRSLTPEKRSRTPDDRVKPTRKGEMNSSQSSLVSRQSSGSRSSTLERRYDEGYLRSSSRSSSNSSYSGDEASHRRSHLRPVNLRSGNVAGDYKIRRSSHQYFADCLSLQLSERSPNRQLMASGAQSHKVVVRLGNVPKERPTYPTNVPRQSSQLLSQESFHGYPISPSNTMDRLRRESTIHSIDVDKRKSFDNNNYGMYEHDFDKSRSFDENYGLGNEKRAYVSTEARSYSHDRVFGSTGTSSSNEYSHSSASRNRSPQSYGSRLYDHELQYDMSRNAMNRSPIINYGQRRVLSRSPIPGASKVGMGHYPNPTDLYLIRKTPDSEYNDRITPDFGKDPAPLAAVVVPKKTSPSAAAAFKEAELVKKFLCATKNKLLQRESRNVVVPGAGTPTAGSCTASSCDFWPHCGVTSSLTVEQNQLTKSGSDNCLNRRSTLGGVVDCESGTRGEVIVIGDEAATGGTGGAPMVPIKANSYGGVGHHPLKKQRNIEISDGELAAVIGPGRRYYYPGGATPNQSVIVKANSITFLGEHEMPITRDRVSKSSSHGGASSSTTTINTLLAKQHSSGSVASCSRSNYASLSDQLSQKAKMACGGANSGGGSSNSSVKSNSSNYKINRSPSNRSNPGSSSDHQQRRTSNVLVHGSAASMMQADSGNSTRDRKSRGIPQMRPRSASIKRKFEMKLKSRSLPKSFMRYSNLTSDDLELTAIFSANSPLQLRAVSSPSLTEPTQPTSPVTKVAATEVSCSNNGSNLVRDRTGSHPQQMKATGKTGPNNPVSESVLQKFRKTFSQFKPSKTVNGSYPATGGINNSSSNNVNVSQHSLPYQHAVEMSADSATQQDRPQAPTHQPNHHRFGPLIWRSSKERRKTKSHRRDKCNSGDSGIQVELEPDEQLLPEGIEGTESSSSPRSNISIRRANSAKTNRTDAASSILKHKLSLKSSNKENVANISRLSGKSLSQPSGLDCVAGDEELEAADLSESDSDDTVPAPVHHTRMNDEPVFAEVLFSFRPAGSQELALEKGALVEVLKRDPGPWWWGRIKSDAILSGRPDDEESSECGWFPMDFVKLLPTYNMPKQIIIINNNEGGSRLSAGVGGGLSEGEVTKNCDMDSAKGDDVGADPIPAGSNGASSSQEQTKENVIKELLETEINYVKLLNSLCLGFIKPLREREDIFPVESVNLIFANLEKIWRFQQTFLDALRIAVPNNRIGEVFLEYQSAFMIYSSYCNSYPRALMELENYANNKEACIILENCRLAQNLPELPLSAHLLAPIQRICRYPLHLSELVKHSPTRKELLPLLNFRKCTKSDLETMDCREVFELALAAMRRVTEMVNEGKRHSEYLSRIQSRFENFQGPSINIHSTRLFLQTDAIRMSPNLWNNTYTLFLFDRQLIYCKKDLLKRTNYIYKGRIFLDNCRILNLPDGKMFGVTLKNALRLYCDTRNKWFDFCFRSSSSKLRFLNTLSAERQFCGESLFVSELDGACVDEDNLSDREYFPFTDEKDGCSNTDTETSNERVAFDLADNLQFSLLGTGMTQSARSSSNSSVLKESPTNVGGKQSGNTLPKKSRKLTKDQQQQQQAEYSSHSLGRRKLGNWFRKAKSTNSTPSQSPTHNPMALSLAAINSSHHSHQPSDSSSASSPGLGYQRTLSALPCSSAANNLATTGVPSTTSTKEDEDRLLF
ncbi:uncharacterized protein LOC129724532 isoform X2 [Wyeomyia smithii]|uniref:uncharacterized protein LOC129724532 isoform X2 n=1 Tax=Wyeomyia smithii TaxID=174621 RepID=UPI002467C328|nr:uncharacterized protein LOC129724532 isoform X2 [Wyeomyia smithii]